VQYQTWFCVAVTVIGDILSELYIAQFSYVSDDESTEAESVDIVVATTSSDKQL
jgi:hypothetical protein